MVALVFFLATVPVGAKEGVIYHAPTNAVLPKAETHFRTSCWLSEKTLRSVTPYQVTKKTLVAVGALPWRARQFLHDQASDAPRPSTQSMQTTTYKFKRYNMVPFRNSQVFTWRQRCRNKERNKNESEF